MSAICIFCGLFVLSSIFYLSSFSFVFGYGNVCKCFEIKNELNIYKYISL